MSGEVGDMVAMRLDEIGAVVAALSALVGAPLTMIVFYLRAIRDAQRTVEAGLTRRVAEMEAECRRIKDTVDGIEVGYTPKEEWLRETMMARKQLARLTEIICRLQAELESSRALATQFHRATNAIIELAERLVERLGASRETTCPRPQGRDAVGLGPRSYRLFAFFLAFFLPAGPRTASLHALAMRNFTTFLAGILIASPVAGFRPMRAFRCTRTSFPSPGSVKPFLACL